MLWHQPNWQWARGQHITKGATVRYIWLDWLLIPHERNKTEMGILWLTSGGKKLETIPDLEVEYYLRSWECEGG